MKTIRIIYPDSFSYLNMSDEAAEHLITEIEKRPAGSFYSQGFEKSIQKTLIMLPAAYRNSVQETEPARKLVPGSIISLPEISYEINFKKINSGNFITYY